jgi:hypothetical protein
MKFICACAILMSVGIALNYALNYFFKNRLMQTNKRLEPLADDHLSKQMEDEVQQELGNLKKAMGECMRFIEERTRLLQEKEEALEALIGQVDERIADLQKLKHDVSQVPDVEGEVAETLGHSHKVYELYKQGMDAARIAQHLGIGRGEVELRLGLLQRIKN